MPKKSVAKTPNKTLELDKKLNAIKGEVAIADAIIDEEEKEIIQESPIDAQKCLPEPIKEVKKQPKIIEEIVEEEDPEPIIIRKIIKKKPKQIIEEVEEEEPKQKKKDGRGRPRKIQQNDEDNDDDNDEEDKKYMSLKQKNQQKSYYNNRNRVDTILDETNIDLLRQEMRKEMKRRLMSSLFDNY